MKRILYVVILVSVFTVGNIEVSASSGQLRKASIKSCNGITYGQHSSDNHWHIAEEKDGKYYATGDPISSDPCSSSNNSSSSNTESNNTSNNNTSSNNTTTNNNNTTSTNNNKPSNNTSINNNTNSSNSSTVSGSNNTSSTQKEETKSNDNTLKVIVIDGKDFSPEEDIIFSTTKDKVVITATPNDSKAKYEIKNNSILEIGENKILIEVVAEDGSTKTYNLNISRNKVISSNTGIKIFINNEVVDFDNGLATVYVGSSETELNVEYVLDDESSKVEMDKIKELKVGDNELKIKVIAEDGTKKEYKIIIHKYSKTDDIISTVIGLGILGGIGYGIYYVIKKFIPILKKNILKIKNK